ncbi:uncharacterized protein LOC129222698 [Uloborus diversus]|uniref:uncharacterized protein LOC129222698 n=1 Tax=Uloborus diversus TaxID=327109 RepID=UPI002409BEBD|nr:uncharacterized protein LOC129222698 [Uloborus diversus]
MKHSAGISRMRILAFLLLFGIASASYERVLDDLKDELSQDFAEGLLEMSSLGLLDKRHVYMADENVREEIVEKLKEALNKVVEKIKEAIKDGKIIREELMEKLRNIQEKLKLLHVDLGEQFLHKIREIVRGYIKQLLEKLGVNEENTRRLVHEALAEVNLKDLLRQVRDHLRENVDPEIIKQGILKIFDQSSEVVHQLLQVLKEKGRKRLLILLDQLLDEDEDPETFHGIKDYWEKIKDFFKDLKIDLQEKYLKFGEWVKEAYDKGLEQSKDKFENIKAIAKEFAKHAKNVSKEVAGEAKEFFNQYKEELGDVWDLLKEAFQRIKERED